MGLPHSRIFYETQLRCADVAPQLIFQGHTFLY